jgi:hypothetical protein
MRLFILTLATTYLLAISAASFAQTSFISLKNIDNKENMVTTTAGSIKFNPVEIAKGILKVKMFNQPAGIYTVQITDADGNVSATKEINHTANTITEIADFGKTFAGGTYQVEITGTNNKKTSQTILLLL